jgi:hypothetical protein
VKVFAPPAQVLEQVLCSVVWVEWEEAAFVMSETMSAYVKASVPELVQAAGMTLPARGNAGWDEDRQAER